MSSAVISLPSWNLTPLRSLNSSVVLSLAANDSGKIGHHFHLLIELQQGVEQRPHHVGFRDQPVLARVQRVDDVVAGDACAQRARRGVRGPHEPRGYDARRGDLGPVAQHGAATNSIAPVSRHDDLPLLFLMNSQWYCGRLSNANACRSYTEL